MRQRLKHWFMRSILGYGGVWILLFGMGLQAQDRPYYFEYLTIAQGLSHNTVHAVLQDRHGFMWFGTENGLNKYDGYSFKVYASGLPSDPQFEGRSVTALMEDQAGNLWAGTQNSGINLLSAQTGRFENLRHHPLFKPLSHAWVYRLFQDRQGRIWVGTMGQGAFLYQPKTQTLQHFRYQNSSLSNDYVLDFAEDTEGNIWAVTGGTGISRFSSQKNRFENLSLDPTGKTELLNFRKTLLADPQGYLWIGTERQGLFKYRISDRSFQVFDPYQGLSRNSIRDLELDAQRNILIATDGGGLHVLSQAAQTIRSFPYNPLQVGGLNTNALYDIWVGKEGNVWIGSFNGGVNVHKAQKTRFEHYAHTGYGANEISNSSVLSLLETRDGRIWVGTDGGGLNLFNPETKTFSAAPISDLSSNVVKALHEDPKGRLWLGFYEKGLDGYDLKTGTLKHYPYGSNGRNTLSNPNVWSIVSNTDGTLWIGTLGGGLNHFDPETELFTHYLHNPQSGGSIASNDVRLVYRDTQNRLWVGTQDKGLDLFDPKTGRFLHYRHQPDQEASLSGDEVRSIFEDHAGRLWIGTEDGGLNLWLGHGRFKRYTTRKGFISNSIMGIEEDAQGNLWISTQTGLTKFNPTREVIENFNFRNTPHANQFNQEAILSTQTGLLIAGGINGLNLLNTAQAPQSTANPPVWITDLKIFNDPVLASTARHVYIGRIETAQTIYLSYLDNAFSLDFASLDYNEPQNNRFIYKLEGFHEAWQNLPLPEHTVHFTNLEAGSYTLRVKGTNGIGQWSTHETALKIVISPPFWKTLWFRFLIVAALVALAAWGLRMLVHRRERELRAQMLESEREILRLRNENLAAELASKNTQLVSIGLQMAHKNDFLNKIKKELHDPSPETDEPPTNKRVLKMIDSEVRGEDFWERFNAYFNEINNGFTQNLTQTHPNLSPNDLRLCSLIIINLSSKEMASILNITLRGVEKGRYRLKKKLGLSVEDDLNIYLKSFKNN